MARSANLALLDIKCGMEYAISSSYLKIAVIALRHWKIA
jgi:hypothetical protein